MLELQNLLLSLTALSILGKKGNITSLELKEKLREEYPLLEWNQKDVNQGLTDFANKYEIEYTFDGTYLICHIPTRNDKNYIPLDVVNIALDTAKGTFFKIVYDNEYGHEQTVNCQLINRKSNQKILIRSGAEQKEVNLRRVKELIIKKVKYNALQDQSIS